MATAKLKSIPEQRRSYAVLLQDLMKRVFARVEWPVQTRPNQ
jgi:hypothetical protein